MKKPNLLLLLAIALTVSAFGQKNTILVKVINPNSYPTGGKGTSGVTTSNSNLNSIFTSMSISSYGPTYSAAYRVDAPASFAPLKNYYTILVDTLYDLDSLKSVFTNCSSCGFSEVNVARPMKKTYVPSDYSTLLSQDPSANWYLDKIKAQDAWNISKSDPNIKIAILDEGFDLTHQDFAGKIVYSDQSSYSANAHGTYVASLAACNTDDGLGMSAIGFNSSLMFYQYNYGNSILAAALDGADVINISIVGSDDPIPSEQLAINQAYAMGVFIVAGAGNGLNTSKDPDMLQYPASYDHVFSVTSVWSDDAHRWQGDPSGNTRATHQHNAAVDLCAPGYHIMHAIPANAYDWGDGTSFASPIVAGTVALIKSAFPCLSNDEIELILKESSDEIYSVLDNNKFLGKLGAGRLNAYEALKLAQSWSNNLVVTSNVFLNKSGNYSSITVKPGGSLSVSNSTLFMLPDAKITVEAGGKLLLIGSTIKSVPASPNPTCGAQMPYKWKGIVVEGSPSLPQNMTNQGYVSLSTSTIQDAMNAVSTVAKDVNGNTVWSKSGGGIIVGFNTTFRNNGRHLEFTSFHSKTTSGSEINNLSSFTGCRFYVDDNTILTYGNKKMITLWDVKGVRFNACMFKNDYNNSNNDKGTGILAIDASVIIQNNKSTGGGRSSFSNLEYGVDATFFPNSTKVLYLNNSDFISNRFGISLREGLGSSIYRSSFDLRNTTFPSSRPVGIQSVNSSVFKVSENSFLENLADVKNNAPTQTFATEVRNSDKTSGQVPFSGAQYTVNSHSNVPYGTQLEGNNGMLEISCNSYNNYYMAINLNPATFLVNPAKPNFGSCAGDPVDRNNIFNWGTAEYDIDIQNWVPNTSTPYLDYVIKDNVPFRPKTWRSHQVNLLKCNGNPTPVTLNSCIRLFEPEPKPNDGIFDNWDPTLKKGEYDLVKADIPNYPSENTPIDPDQYIKYLKLAQLRSEIIYRYSNLILFDDEGNHLPDLITFLTQDQTVQSKKTLVGVYYNNDMTSEARELLNVIANDNEENVGFINYYGLMLTLKESGRNIYEMTTSEISLINDIANGSSSVAVSAQGILNLVFDNRVTYDPMASQIAIEDYEGEGENGGGSNQNYSLTVSPNPSSRSSETTFNVSYDIHTNFTSASIQVTSLFGELMLETPITSVTGEVNLPTSSLPIGLNVVHLVVDGTIVSYKVLNLLP